ncbi:hypothetical protein [Moraxella bovis]|uniref:hypothetical protein n=1 Tax=Moraxella bovis TaxID=476 RepID=UPI002227C66F|nr:hypothetical protein [Moraxella bovis]UYZ91021.1 hypothetical protein LP103_07300 [Moraxella bovis]UYZ91034.1 hypothetical protein LP103_07365 [Moraxella bovis]
MFDYDPYSDSSVAKDYLYDDYDYLFDDDGFFGSSSSNESNHDDYDDDIPF